MANKTEITAKEVFEIFETYWSETEWKNVSRQKVAWLFRDYPQIEIPTETDLRTAKTGRAFYNAVKAVLTTEAPKHLSLKEKKAIAK